MQSVFANKSATITVDLIVGGNFVQPDTDSVVKYTLLGNDFSPMDDYTDREIFIPPSTSLSVVIPAEANTIVGQSEIRTLLLDVVVGGKVVTFKEQYRVSKIPAYTTTKDNVRLVFGLNDSDLSNDLIDLDSCYFELLTKYPSLEEWFKGGGINAIKANRILTLTCALSFSNGLRLLAVASESDGTSKMTRFEKAMDFDEQINAAKAELDDLIDELTEGEGGAGAIDYFNVVTTEDIFTGE